MKRSVFKGIILPLLLALVGVSIAVGVYVTTTGGSLFELRKKASEIKGSQLRFKGPSEVNVVNVGDTFTVDLILDTTTDSQYTISGVDAVVSYSFQNSSVPTPSCVPRVCAQAVPPADFCKDGKIVIKGPQGPCDCPPPPTCIKADQVGGASGITWEEQQVNNNFFRPGGGLGLISVTPGKIFDSYPTYPKNVPQPIPLPRPVPCGGIQGLMCPSGNVCVYDNGTTKPPPLESDSMGKCVPESALLGGGNIGSASSSTTNTSPVTISGIKNYSVNEKGYFKGFTGQGIFASATFIAQYPGKATFSLVYKGPSVTDDTNVNGFLANQPVSLQKPQERLLTPPQAFTVEIVASQITPTPTPQVCAQVITPARNKTTKQCQVFNNSCLPDGWILDRSCGTSTPTPTPPAGCRYEARPCAQPVGGVATDCGMELVCTTPTATPTVAPPTPTPTPVPSARLNIYVESDGKAVYREVRIYGQRDYVTLLNQVQGATVYAAGFGGLGAPAPAPPLPTPEPISSDGLTLLGSTVTDSSGNATIEIPSQYHNIPWRLFVQTPSHLIRQAQSVKLGETPGIPGSVVGSNVIVFKPNTVARVMFTGLIPGDLYIAEGKMRQDGVINNFDLSDLFRVWGPYARVQVVPVPPPIAADFNDDGVVNNRDFAIILSNFGKEGDISEFLRVQPRPLPVTSISPQQ